MAKAKKARKQRVTKQQHAALAFMQRMETTDAPFTMREFPNLALCSPGEPNVLPSAGMGNMHRKPSLVALLQLVCVQGPWQSTG